MKPLDTIDQRFIDPNDDTNAFFLFAHMEDIERAECDAEAAAKLLLIAAEYIENGVILPKPLAEFIATAFKRAASVEQAKRTAELAAYLCLTAPHTRPHATENELGLWVFRQLYDNQLRGDPKSETAVLNAAAKHFQTRGIEISKTAATDKWKAWQKQNKKFVAILERIKAN